MHKYRAKRTTCASNHKHPSKKEARRCDELHLLQKAGKIRGLEREVPYDLVVNGVKVGRYIADFRYSPAVGGAPFVEDCKGMRTPVYRLKAKLMLALHGITILET